MTARNRHLLPAGSLSKLLGAFGLLGLPLVTQDEILDAEQQTFDPKQHEKLLWDAHKVILEGDPAVPFGTAWTSTPTAPISSGPRRRMKKSN